jgi:hypothetical protein
VHRITGCQDLWVNEYTIRYEGRPISVVGIMEFRDGKVVRERIYFRRALGAAGLARTVGRAHGARGATSRNKAGVAGAPATIRLRVQHEVADLAVHLVGDREAQALSERDRPGLEDLRHHVLRSDPDDPTSN